MPSTSEIPFYWPPLPEIPTQKRWLYRNVEHSFVPWVPTKRKRVLLTVEQKFQIVSRIEAVESLTKLSKKFGVGVSAVGDTRRDSEKNQ
ncbi:hypothetical protein AVEN_65265-1 [Araneus ventricosus]|uniref:HTH psq-type domain-containing protein n=1 Tax=Araneus ventricosus TaxID=182803 RepID=A0A4Y2AFQ9_ARAVE|nr:hypothetical protein AVEN_65265-1 [Araneus ventricosus]